MSKKQLLIAVLLIAGLFGFIKKDWILSQLKPLFSAQTVSEKTPLKIVLSTPLETLSPYSLNLDTLIRTGNLYESLVAFDRNLKITPALAVSWGNLDTLTWEFKLRRGVTFHDGAPFNAESVLSSFEEAKTQGGSEIKSYTDSIKEIKIRDPYTLELTTRAPDPLILSKLTKFFITKPGFIGTGPYLLAQPWTKGQTLKLKAYADYWGKKPRYQAAEYEVVPNKSQRTVDFEQGRTDLLIAVPPEQALLLPKEQLRTKFSLETNFMLFNLKDPLLEKSEIREAIFKSFDPLKIEEIGNHFVRQSTQFIAPGVYGYNGDIPIFKYNEKNKPRALFGSRLEPLTLDYPKSYQTLAEYLITQLRDSGFSVKAHVLSPEELLENLKSNRFQLLIIGWQAENGDAGDFLDAFIKSTGEFNQGRYSNPEIDRLIDQTREELDPEKRLKALKTILEKVSSDLLGVPLFESSRLYALKKGLKWEPRVDGLVLATDVQ